MAHKPTSFRVDEKKREIIIYTNVDALAENFLKEHYLSMGYKAKFEEKKPSKKVSEMRAELKADPDALEEFNRLYKSKGTGKDVGFFAACKFYNDWKKNK